jgi:hypothetical protein
MSGGGKQSDKPRKPREPYQNDKYSFKSDDVSFHYRQPKTDREILRNLKILQSTS